MLATKDLESIELVLCTWQVSFSFLRRCTEYHAAHPLMDNSNSVDSQSIQSVRYLLQFQRFCSACHYNEHWASALQHWIFNVANSQPPYTLFEVLYS